jgi:hypothetical protein
MIGMFALDVDTMLSFVCSIRFRGLPSQRKSSVWYILLGRQVFPAKTELARRHEKVA